MLVDKGYAKDIQDAFDKYLDESARGFVQRQEVPMEEALERILASGGVPSLAHPIRIAKNNQKTSDLVFRQQLIATVAGIIRLYDDLVSLGEDQKVKQETLALAQRFHDDNQIQVEQGTLAPVELTRAQAQVAAAQQERHRLAALA